ncbi:MAG: NUDIX hydrolase [Stygiobacter sp.]|nr:MAG: NUDIX hydrolase [Stygiobacter sp.]
MHRTKLLFLLNNYFPEDVHENEMKNCIIFFVNENPSCFDRSLLVGHITASAMIVNHERTHSLFTHHTKLNKWLQLGGHSDGDSNTLNVALREAEEESGLKSIIPITENIFDVDAHEIPARKNEPAHIHYDIRFLFKADDNKPLLISSESKDLAWISLDDIERYTTEESVLRMVRKVKQIAAHK